MRSLVRVLLLLLISMSFVTAMLKSNSKTTRTKPDPEILKDSSTDEDDNETASVSMEGTSEEESEEDRSEFYSNSKADIMKAWRAAAKLTDRNPDIWRKDKNNNVILTQACALSSPLAFRALVKIDENSGGISFEAIQEEYYGEDDEDNHENALKYRPKDQEQDDFLSLMEIAFNGHVSDDRGDSYCWVPSLIHQDLFLRHDSARRWHANLFSKDFKYGMAGHNLAFQQMGVGLKDVRHYSEKVLDSLNQVHDFMFIKNYQSQCSDLVGQINFVEDKAKLAEKIKNNWGLPRVDDFIDPKTVKKTVIPIIAKPKKTVTTKSVSLSDQDWPSLSMTAAPPANGKTKAPKTTKTTRRVIDI